MQSFEDLEKGMSNKSVTEKYVAPRNTVLTWVKNKEKLLALLKKKGTNSKRQKLRCGDFKKVDKVVHTWFSSKRS